MGYRRPLPLALGELEAEGCVVLLETASLLEHLDDVFAMGFDDRFVRMWDYYLSISEAGFRTGMTQDLQIALAKSRGRP